MKLKLPTKSDPIAVILKLPGETCNINCSYCYEKRKPYKDNSSLQPKMLRHFLETLNGRPLSLELHGGEPLLIGQSKMSAIFAEIKKYEGAVKLRIQTNGTLLNNKWLDFLKCEWPDIDIGISLDGDLEGNSYRVDYSDNSTHHKVEEALRLTDNYGINVGVISTVTRKSLPRASQILDYLAQFQSIKNVKFAPCFDFNVETKKRYQQTNLFKATEKGVPSWGISPSEYALFLIEAFEIWRTKQYFRQFLAEPFTSVIRTLANKKSSSCHFDEKKCAFMLTLYPDGRIGSCDELRMPNALMANVYDYQNIDDILYFQKNKTLKKELSSLLDKCEVCSYKQTCGGGCLNTRLNYHETSFYEEYCKYRMDVIDTVKASMIESVLAS